MKELIFPIGEQSFSEIRTAGKVYIDKTGYIPLLLKNKYYFLSRPRRFGKSLFLSTLENFFRGRKELFEGLHVRENFNWNWEPYPVIRMDFTGEDYTVDGNLEKFLSAFLRDNEEEHGIEPYPDDTISLRFASLIKKLSKKTGKKVVILVDEYDKPILDAIDNDSVAKRNTEVLRALYSVLKAQSESIEMAFLTGITRLGNLNIFSGINNLKDISLYDDYAAICGISEWEINTYLKESIKRFAELNKISLSESLKLLKTRYDGYHFSIDSPDIYNPFSLFSCLETGRLGYRWYTSGNPYFLFTILRKNEVKLSNLENIKCRASVLEGVHASISDVLTLLYQTGYLTIKDYLPEEEAYLLGYPNEEVRKAFIEGLLSEFSGVRHEDSESAISELKKLANTGDVDGMMRVLDDFFCRIPYDLQLDKEVNFQNVIYCLFVLLGAEVEAEHHTSNGRIDLVLKTEKYIYIFEFKINSKPEKALVQIETKDYKAAFLRDGRQIIEIGVNFSTRTRRIEMIKNI